MKDYINSVLAAGKAEGVCTTIEKKAVLAELNKFFADLACSGAAEDEDDMNGNLVVVVEDAAAKGGPKCHLQRIGCEGRTHLSFWGKVVEGEAAFNFKKENGLPLKGPEGWEGPEIFLHAQRNPLRSDFCAAWSVPPVPKAKKQSGKTEDVVVAWRKNKSAARPHSLNTNTNINIGSNINNRNGSGTNQY